MAYAADGGLLTYWGTPTGCTLENDVAKTPQTSAYDYMKAVRIQSSSRCRIPASISCRSNYLLLVTDGQPTGRATWTARATTSATTRPVLPTIRRPPAASASRCWPPTTSTTTWA